MVRRERTLRRAGHVVLRVDLPRRPDHRRGDVPTNRTGTREGSTARRRRDPGERVRRRPTSRAAIGRTRRSREPAAMSRPTLTTIAVVLRIRETRGRRAAIEPSASPGHCLASNTDAQAVAFLGLAEPTAIDGTKRWDRRIDFGPVLAVVAYSTAAIASISIAAPLGTRPTSTALLAGGSSSKNSL